MKKNEELIDTLIKHKNKITIFNNLDNGIIKEIVTNIEFLQYKKDEIIVKEGELSLDIFLLISGQCRVVVKDDIEISTISENQVFGEFSPITKKPRNATIEANIDCAIIKFNLDLDVLDRKLNGYGTLYKNLSKELIKKFEIMNFEAELSKIIY